MDCLSIVLTIITICDASIKWDIKGEYVIYGREATLTCNGYSCPSKAIKKWIGGPNYNLLCFDDYSTDSAKYEMMSNYTPKFDLMIKSFNYSDANCEYTCSCGFLQYTKMLKLAHLNFIHLPVVEKNSSKLTDSMFQIDLSMRVFPLPECKLFYENKSFPVNFTVHIIPTEGDIELHRVRIQYTLNLMSCNCKGNLKLTCQVRSLEHSILLQKIDFCKATKVISDGHGAKYIVIGAVSSVFIILITIMTIYAHRFGKANMSNTVSEDVTRKNSEGFDLEYMISCSDEAEGGPMLNQNKKEVAPVYICSSNAEITSCRLYENG